MFLRKHNSYTFSQFLGLLKRRQRDMLSTVSLAIENRVFSGATCFKGDRYPWCMLTEGQTLLKTKAMLSFCHQDDDTMLHVVAVAPGIVATFI